MSVQWTQHRFSGGVLALNVANTVVHRGNPSLSFDRFEDAAEIDHFAAAASIFCADELSGRALVATGDGEMRSRIVAMRETTDRLFRNCAQSGQMDTVWLRDVLHACARGLTTSRQVVSPSRPFGSPSTPLPLDTAISLSTLSLVVPEKSRRIRICRNCGWLFLDRSRNASRLWCDMAVCGNRQKAKRHYRRLRVEKGKVERAKLERERAYG